MSRLSENLCATGTIFIGYDGGLTWNFSRVIKGGICGVDLCYEIFLKEGS